MQPLAPELVGLERALGRVLAEPVAARRDQPPLAVSAMDGYAVIAADLAAPPATLELVGEVPAGARHRGRLDPGQAVRIFTGAPLPDGADTIAIQENATRDGDRVTVHQSEPAGRWVRPAGLDFAAGSVGLEAGRRLTSRDIGLAAAMDRPWLSVRRRPRVGVLATGNEIVLPGEGPDETQIVSSNGYGLCAFVEACGGTPVHLGVAPDDPDRLAERIDGARGLDLLVTCGGASVGDHDLVQDTLQRLGADLDFWKIAMRPGKPLMFARLGATPVLGVPGNPVSGLVCATLFLRPAIDRLQGRDADPEPRVPAVLGRALPANGARQEYMRARVELDPARGRVATPFDAQDSSMLRRLAQADGLVVRSPHAPAAEAGEPVDLLPLGDGHLGI
jgi:molybdopterin molybdotransferase